MMRIKTIAAYLIILVAIYAIMNEIALFTCSLSDYNCVFGRLLNISGLILILYLASKIL
ncbi:MAG: hypothetical protein ABIG84_04740 [archaeon]